MCTEAAHAKDEREALSWALGVLRAGCVERLRAIRAGALPSTHTLGLWWIAMFIASSGYNIGLLLAARWHWDRAALALGALLHGFDYARFARLGERLSPVLLALLGLVCVLFCLAYSLSRRRHRLAFAAFCAATALSLVAWLCELGVPAYLEAMPRPHRWRIGLCFALTAVVLSLLRSGTSPASRAPIH